MLGFFTLVTLVAWYLFASAIGGFLSGLLEGYSLLAGTLAFAVTLFLVGQVSNSSCSYETWVSNFGPTWLPVRGSPVLRTGFFMRGPFFPAYFPKFRFAPFKLDRAASNSSREKSGQYVFVKKYSEYSLW